MASTEAAVARLSRRSAVALAAFVCLLGIIAPRASAEEKKDYALIYGTVWNAADRAVPGVPVKIQRVGDKKPKWSLVSDARGEFAQRVPSGRNDYIVTADIKVPKGDTKPQTKLHVDKNERVDISLHLTN
jgi:DNA primase